MPNIAKTSISGIPVIISAHKVVVAPDKDICYGTCTQTARGIHIKIEAGLGPERFAEVLLHELTHAVDFVMNVGLSEKQTNTLGVGLSGALQGLGCVVGKTGKLALGKVAAKKKRPRRKRRR